MSNKNKRKMKITILLSLFLVIVVGSMIFTKVVFDQEFKRVEVSKYSGYLSYDDVKEDYDRNVINFDSGKNSLTGYIYGEENHKGLVIIAHGLGFGAENYLSEALYFVDQGWRVFTYDCTGTYNSEGKGTVGLPQSVIDLDAALTYIESDQGMNDLPIMLYGHSWGGYAVTAILNDDHDIRAVVSISGFNSPNKLLFEGSKSNLGFVTYVMYPYEWLYQKMLFGKHASMTSVDGINKVNIPVMIIHGSEDKEILYDGASIISQRDNITNPNVVFKTYRDENHNGHNDIFQSNASLEYIKLKNEEYKQLFNNYDGNIPDEIKEAYYAGVDRFKTSELDSDFMNDINLFFETSLIN